MTARRRQHLRCGPMHCSWRSLQGDVARAASVLSFPASDVRFVHRGRVAIWWAAKGLGLSAGDEILVPAYHCGSEVDPLVRFGLTVRAIDVQGDLSVSIEKVAAAVTEKTRAVYVIHYFGVAEDLTALATWCRERSLLLIEDCALALFSESDGRPVGHAGDAAIFSFRKTLPVPDGGALVLKNRRMPAELAVAPPPSRVIRFELGRLLGQWARGHLPPWVSFRDGHKAATRADAVDVSVDRLLPLSDDDRFDPGATSWAMSHAAQRICGGIDAADVKARRRANYEQLSDRLRDIRGVRPLLRALPEGACPVAYPIECVERTGLYRHLLECSIAAIPWWAGFHEAVEWEAVPVARRLKQSVVALPVHQGLEPEHMAYIAECVYAFAARAAAVPTAEVVAAKR